MGRLLKASVMVIVLFSLIAVMIWGILTVDIEAYTQGQCTFPEILCQVGIAVGFPGAWLSTDKILWYGIVPLIGLTLIIYGFLSTMRIFGRKTYLYAGLSFCIAFSTIPLKGFVALVATMFAIMGGYATFLFVFLFVIGGGFVVSALFKGWSAGSIESEIFDEKINARIQEKEAYEKQKDALQKQIENLGEEARAGKLQLAEYESLTMELRERLANVDGNLKSKDTEIKYLKEEKNNYQKRIKELEKTAKKAG